jgi:diacylglycerol kinase (ATP)
MHVRAIVNPNSSNGRTRAAWPRIAEALDAAIGPLETVFTDSPLAATERTREALNDGVDLVIAVGGDGTVNEVVNGFFAPPTPDLEDVPLRPEAELAVLMSGTGGDFRKTFEFAPDLPGQIQHIARGATRTIDVGRIDYTDHHGRPAARYFINIASFGLSGWCRRPSTGPASPSASTAASRSSWPRCGPPSATRCRACACRSTTRAARARRQHRRGLQRPLLRRRDAHGPGGAPRRRPVRHRDHARHEHPRPAARPQRDLPRHARPQPQGHQPARAKDQRLAAAGPDALLDVDGETPGRLPATFTIIPSVLKFRC